MAKIKALCGITLIAMLMVLIPDSSNKTEGCCPRGGGTGGSSGGGSPVPSSRPALGPGIQPLIQNLKAGGGSLFGAAEPWEAWWTRRVLQMGQASISQV